MKKEISSQKKKGSIGLALGGGGARGLAYIGIFQELERAGIAVDYIAGTSAGALIGAIYASGLGSEEMAELALKITWRDLVAPRPTLRSILSSEPIFRFLEKYCRVSRFEELQIPFSVVVSDLKTGSGVRITSGELFPAIVASCSIPLVFPPVTLNGKEYIDGGFAALIPVHTVKEMGADIGIACDVNYNALPDMKAGNFVSMLMKLMVLVAHKSIREAKTRADAVINVDAQGISLTALDKAGELIRRGRQATKAILPELYGEIQCSLAHE